MDMAYEMHGEKLHRTVQCAVSLCRNRDTFVFYRGRDFGLNPMHICRDCLRDILREYIRMDGAEAAWELLGDVVSEIIPADAPAEEAEPAEQTAPAEEAKGGRRRKGTGE
jgi:hypothetical protein